MSRNLGIASLGMAALLGFWADLLSGDTAAAALDGVAALGDGLPADCGRPHVHRRQLRSRSPSRPHFGVAPWTRGSACRSDRGWMVQLARRGRAISARLKAAHSGPGRGAPARRPSSGIRPAGLTAVASTVSRPTGDRDALPGPLVSGARHERALGIYDTSAPTATSLTQIGQPDSTSSTGPPA